MKSRGTLREEAELRQSDRDTRSDEQQIALLVSHGFGSCKEVRRLRKRIAKRKEKST